MEPAITFSPNSTAPTIAILIKESAYARSSLQEHYIEPLKSLGVDEEEVIAFPLLYEGKKVRAKIAKAYLDHILDTLKKYPLKQLIIADSIYFKILTGVSKVTSYYGDNINTAYKGYNYKAVYVPNHLALLYDPANQDIINTGLAAAVEPKEKKIIKTGLYARTAYQARKILSKLLTYPSLACDIETSGLALGSTLTSIAFAWNKHEGAAIYLHDQPRLLPVLRDFFICSRVVGQQIIFHRSLFDVKHLIWLLFMKKPFDLAGMRKGLDTFKYVEDSQLITYLAKNSTTDVSLKLKENSYEFTGNYAIDLIDTTIIPPDKLMEYNLKDVLATWYVWEKYWPVCEKDEQLRFYAEILHPSIRPLLKMMLVGLPIDLTRVSEIRDELSRKQARHEYALQQNDRIKAFEWHMQMKAMRDANASLKNKVKPFKDFKDITFNPESPKQVAELLYTDLGYKVTRKTDTGQPATGTKVLNELLGKGRHDDILKHLIERKKTNKILTSFIPAFYKYTIEGFLHGELNLGGTQSGRLSSSSPNLQNQPSGSTYGKLIKSCFRSPPGWLFWGIDFNALEERIGSILSGDPNRIKVYTEGFDGHCLRAYRYFKDQMTGINPDDPKSINSIEHLFPEFRNKSKAPTFALQYGGTAYTLVNNCGIPEEQSQAIENAYHDLYQVSDQFMANNLAFASQHGYVKLAFGLRLRTPLIERSVINSSHTPKQVQAEGRSANNAITQSWGLLINRAIIEAEKTFEQSEFRDSILLSNTIHDSTYGIVKDEPATLAFLNDTIVTAMEWNDHPDIYSDEVPMRAVLEIGDSWDTLKPYKK